MSENLNSFLAFGYFLGDQKNISPLDLSNIDKEMYKNIHEAELIDIGSTLWFASISSNFKVKDTHLVPLSGGLDSRAVLAALLEHTEAKNIHTYTFGTPGTLDYEIGNYVAEKIGTTHTSFDLTKHKYKQNELLDISQRLNFKTILFHHWPVWEVDKLYGGCTHWSGFMGDPLTGGHLQKTPSKTIAAANDSFIEKNMYVKSIRLSKNYEFRSLMESNCIDADKLKLDEQLDFEHRQRKFVAPLVLMKGYGTITPFLYQPYVDFILSLDDKFRLNQYLYKKILLNTFPREFSYKTKTNFGLPLAASNKTVFFKRLQDKILRMTKLGVAKGINYLDFDEKIRTKTDFSEVICSNVLDLKERGTVDWVDVSGILNSHLTGKGDFSDALIVLASLEIHLKNGLKL